MSGDLAWNASEGHWLCLDERGTLLEHVMNECSTSWKDWPMCFECSWNDMNCMDESDSVLNIINDIVCNDLSGLETFMTWLNVELGHDLGIIRTSWKTT